MFWKKRNVMETPRLYLRRWAKDDFGDFKELMMNPEVSNPAGMNPIDTELKARELFERSLPEDGTFAVVLKETEKVIGQIKFQDDFRRYKVNSISIGYELNQAYWGQGYMPEALAVMVKYAFEIKTVDIISIGHFTINSRSRRVIEKVGFKHEGTMRMGFKRYDGIALDDELYSMTKAEYLELGNIFDKVHIF